VGRRGSKRPPAFSGFALVDKPCGWTSHAVVQHLRRVFGQRQVGHTGTLDPMATGLLVVALGSATRLARFVEARDKVYTGTAVLGVGTDTYDAEGRVVDEAPFTGTAVDVDRARAELSGWIEQPVPAHSAVRVDGERLYVRARRGENPRTPVRRVHVRALEVLELAGDRLRFSAHVSKGTYIRSLAVQIGQALGVPAHLAALRREAIGVLKVDRAMGPDAFAGRADELWDASAILADRPRAVLSPDAVREVGFGRPLPGRALAGRVGPAWRPGDALVLADGAGRVVAMARARVGADEIAGKPDEPALAYLCVLPAASS